VNFNNVRIVLVATSHPGNIGAAARAMKNMGLTQLVLVKPKIWPALEAESLAVSAKDVLESAVVVETLAEAIADCHLVFGTSARLRTMPVPLLDPANCAKKIVTEMSTKRIALVFGREISGLSNEELHLCHYHIHIPVNPEYTSLNLAAAVMVLAYEIRKTALETVQQSLADSTQEWDKVPATVEELDLYLAHLEAVLIKLDFHKPENPRQLMRRLRRMYQRIQLDTMEINILRGIVAATESGLPKS